MYYVVHTFNEYCTSITKAFYNAVDTWNVKDSPAVICYALYQSLRSVVKEIAKQTDRP